jgi:hypothetical protein
MQPDKDIKDAALSFVPLRCIVYELALFASQIKHIDKQGVGGSGRAWTSQICFKKATS